MAVLAYSFVPIIWRFFRECVFYVHERDELTLMRRCVTELIVSVGHFHRIT